MATRIASPTQSFKTTSMAYQRGHRLAARLLITATAVVLLAAIWRLWVGDPDAGRVVRSSGYLSIVAGLVQLEVSGFFTRLIDHYDNDAEYPYGPPSHVTREIIDNPDRPVRSAMRGKLDFDVRTGFWLVVGGTLLQLTGEWV